MYEVEIADVDADVIRPCASTVITGTAVVEPYEPAVTAVSSRVAVIVVPDAAVVIPVPPATVNVSESRSMSIVPESPAASKSLAVTCEST